jgi:hypothetical protein
VATQFSDMSLGGTSFGAGYTPIRFAPLVSLTGPIAAPATPAAPEAPAAPMMQAPMMPTMAEMPDNAYMTGQAGTYPDGMPPIGARSGEQIRGDLMNLGGFFMSPIGSMLNYAMTGQTPAQAMQAMFGGAQGQQGQGTQGPFAGFSDWFARNVFGPEEVPLYETRAPLETATPVSAQIIDMSAALGITPEQVMAIMGAQPAPAVGPVSTLGMDMFGPQGAPTSAPAAAGPAQTFAVQTGGGYAPSDFGGISGVTEGFGSPGSVADVSGGQAPY